MVPVLKHLLSYRNKNVLERYTMDYPNNCLTSEEAFQELMKFFWLSLKHKAEKLCAPTNTELDFICGIHSEMKEIDDMWHTFLLFTKDYAAFCKNYLDIFFHHSPTTNEQKLEVNKQDFANDFSKFLSFTYDYLGEETVQKWFGVLAE
ncbi:TPA: hypothetical protein ACT9MM_001425 [Legionella pneumophila]|nr:hypothetical protein [Legionella pneumophila]HAT8831231.1 hypothetical protein [Legionella pneumophila subsp. pneumophila]HAT1994831.1 hypothetical protein [Legionella pneumophila]HAT2052477.1 hypothetical protein [Legionella pneumophila]HAT2061637.1 hypothetical protein [Legionella pneumophila]